MKTSVFIAFIITIYSAVNYAGNMSNPQASIMEILEQEEGDDDYLLISLYSAHIEPDNEKTFSINENTNLLGLVQLLKKADEKVSYKMENEMQNILIPKPQKLKQILTDLHYEDNFFWLAKNMYKVSTCWFYIWKGKLALLDANDDKSYTKYVENIAILPLWLILPPELKNTLKERAKGILVIQSNLKKEEKLLESWEDVMSSMTKEFIFALGELNYQLDASFDPENSSHQIAKNLNRLLNLGQNFVNSDVTTRCSYYGYNDFFTSLENLNVGQRDEKLINELRAKIKDIIRGNFCHFLVLRTYFIQVSDFLNTLKIYKENLSNNS